MYVRFFIFYFLHFCVLTRGGTLIDPVLQWSNCNNCYAVAARDVLLWHKPSLKNITVHQLMKDSHQTCNGGVPTRIWDMYFRNKSKVVSISKYNRLIKKLQNILLKYGPFVVNKGLTHLVTVFHVDTNGFLVRDPKQIEYEIWDIPFIKSSLPFFYVAYPT